MAGFFLSSPVPQPSFCKLLAIPNCKRPLILIYTPILILRPNEAHSKMKYIGETGGLLENILSNPHFGGRILDLGDFCR